MDTNAVIVVMETGSEWPAWVRQCRPGSNAVITQQERETPQQLAARVIDRAEADASVELWVIACNERVDEAAIAERRSAASALLGAMARRGHGSLLFSVSRRSSGRVRHALSAIASDLAQTWEGSGVLVSVRFGVEVPEPAEAAERHVA
jgi:hypothetical protein